MTPVWIFIGLTLAFVGTHMGLGIVPIRKKLVERWGERPFTVFFVVISVVTFVPMVIYYAMYRGFGPPGPALGRYEGLQLALIALIVLGVVIITAGLAEYFHSPMALLAKKARQPVGIARITRHPFFIGMALFSLAHLLLSVSMMSVIFFAGIAALGILGAIHQDRKMLVQIGPEYREYLAQTSTVPFMAILAGRQKLVFQELSLWHVLLGLGIAVVLRLIHDYLFIEYGIPFAIAATLGSIYMTIASMRNAAAQRRAGSTRPSASEA